MSKQLSDQNCVIICMKCVICCPQAGGKDLLKRSWKNLADHITIEVRDDVPSKVTAEYLLNLICKQLYKPEF